MNFREVFNHVNKDVNEIMDVDEVSDVDIKPVEFELEKRKEKDEEQERKEKRANRIKKSRMKERRKRPAFVSKINRARRKKMNESSTEDTLVFRIDGLTDTRSIKRFENSVDGNVTRPRGDKSNASVIAGFVFGLSQKLQKAGEDMFYDGANITTRPRVVVDKILSNMRFTIDETKVNEDVVNAADMSNLEFEDYLWTKGPKFLEGMVGHFDAEKEKVIKQVITRKNLGESKETLDKLKKENLVGKVPAGYKEMLDKRVEKGWITQKEADKMYKEVAESKVNEDDFMGGGATVANEPQFNTPKAASKPGPSLNPKTKAEREPGQEVPLKKEKDAEQEEEDEELTVEGEKEYFGNKGGEEYYYFVIIPSESGTKDLQIQDANDDVVFSAQENQISVDSRADFLWKGIQELELSNIATEIVDKYLMPDEETEDVEKGEGRAETGEEQDQPQTETPKESGVIPELGAPAYKGYIGDSKIIKETFWEELEPNRISKLLDIDADTVRKVVNFIKNINADHASDIKSLPFISSPFSNKGKVGESKIQELLEKFGLLKEELGEELDPNHISELLGVELSTAEKIVQLIQNLEADSVDNAELDRGEKEETPEEKEKKLFRIDLDKLYKTGDVGEAKIGELLEKYGLTESNIDILLEKYGLNEEDDFHPEKKPIDAEQGSVLAPEEDQPEGAVPLEADGSQVSNDSEVAPLGVEPKAEDMSSPAAAEANIKMQYPEEPYTTTALAFADSLIDEPKVYGSLRNIKWPGVYANSETFLKQAKIVGKYNEFNPDIAKRLVDAVGEGAKFRLGREGSVVVYFTIRDSDQKISLETLKGIVRADEVNPTPNPGEARLWWD